ncbi:MAG: LuxR C-terminal-related transcriptional regulator [Coxiellaceae bacterium]|nr:LuxR C-terminal-related transcriptional regulator [Coxiellaceae bacterium]
MKQIAEFEARLKDSTDITTINTVLSHLMQQYRISMYSFTYYGRCINSSSKLKYSHASAAFDIWHQHYINEGYQDVDSTMADLVQNVLPIAWDLQTQLKNSRTEREKQMRLDSIKLGAEKGVTFPLHGPSGEFATFVIVQMQGQQCLDADPLIAYKIFNAARLYFQQIKKQLILQPRNTDNQNLSEREQQVLSCLIENLSTQQIANTLDITERTVNFHIQRINKKFDTKNKYHSVIKALSNEMPSTQSPTTAQHNH